MELLVEVKDLRVVAQGDDGSETTIVKDVGFSLAKGEVLALIGESGSGKTTIALSLLGYARALSVGRWLDPRRRHPRCWSWTPAGLRACAVAPSPTLPRARRRPSIRRGGSWSRSSRAR